MNLSAEQAVIKVNDAFSALPGVLAENGASLDLNTEAGRRNRDAITGLVGDIDGHVQALIDQGASSEEVAWTLHAYRNRLIETGTAAGMSKSEISSYINTLGLTPENIDTWVALHGTGQAEAALAALTRARTATITVATRMAGWFGYDVGGRATGGYVNYLAEGGVPNFRPKGTDTVPAMLTPGEFVIRKSAVDDLGVGFLEKLNAYGSNAFGTMQAAPSGGGTTVHKTYNISVTGIGDRELARKVRDAVATTDRRGV